MIEAKLLEVRDDGTTVPVLALATDGTDLSVAERWPWNRAGYSVGYPYVLLARIDGGAGEITCDPHGWEVGRTLIVAHRHIKEHFAEIEPGAVIDVEFILGERAAPKVPERESVRARRNALLGVSE